MDFLELAKSRYSVRSYLSTPVEPDKLALILEAGRIAPTAANRQPQRVIVISTEQGLDKLKKACRSFDPPLALIVCADHNASWKRAYDGKDADDLDASIVTTHMMLEAASLGLGSLWIGSFKPDVIKTEFALPVGITPISILCVGYAAGEPNSPERHKTERKPMNETVIRESF